MCIRKISSILIILDITGIHSLIKNAVLRMLTKYIIIGKSASLIGGKPKEYRKLYVRLDNYACSIYAPHKPRKKFYCILGGEGLKSVFL